MFNASNPLPYPVSSFNQRVTPPAAAPNEGEMTVVCFAVDWLPYVLGALDQLLLPAAWIGDTAAIQLAQDRAQLLKDMFANPEGCPIADAPTPYWDSDDDVDDIAPVADQTWYGRVEGGDFVEDIADWVLTGFIAAAGGIDAAIAYRTIVPRARVAFRRGEFGEVIRIFADGVQMLELDTSSAEVGEVIETTYALSDSTEPLETPVTLTIVKVS